MLWYSLEVPRRGASNEYPQHMYSLRNIKNIMWIPTLICSYAFWLKTVFCLGIPKRKCTDNQHAIIDPDQTDLQFRVLNVAVYSPFRSAKVEHCFHTDSTDKHAGPGLAFS